MYRPLLFLAIGAFIGSNAINVNVGPTCDVGEQEKLPGLCADNNKCNEYCQKKFGGELISADCVARPNNARECVCKLKCCNSGCWGDPHCWTCDGVKFGYQGLKKYFVLKPIKNYPTLPEFEIQQINKPWQKGPMSILDVSDVIIPDWAVHIALKVPDGKNGYVLTVNERKQDIPWRFSQFDEHRERFVNIAFGNAQKTQVVLTTSFGLRIVYTTKGAGNQMYSDISIDTPRHPELRDNSHGLLGRWNGNPDDDAVDANGVKQRLDDKFSWAFGDSWIVPGGRTRTSDCVRNDAIKQDEELRNQVDPNVRAQAEKLCAETLGRKDLKRCSKRLGRTLPLLQNCITDLIFVGNDAARKEYIENIVESFSETCKRRGHGFRPPTKSSESNSREGGRGTAQRLVVPVPIIQVQPVAPTVVRPAVVVPVVRPAVVAPVVRPAVVPVVRPVVQVVQPRPQPAQPAVVRPAVVRPVAPRPAAPQPAAAAPKDEAVGLDF